MERLLSSNAGRKFLPASDPNPLRHFGGDLRRILIVEDEYLIADDIACAFAKLGYFFVETVTDVPSALLLLERCLFNAAVLDLCLHNTMAFPVADKLLAQRVPFVFMTGHERSVIPTRFSKITRCQKPITPCQVATALIRAVRDQTGMAGPGVSTQAMIRA